jgi:hypothetical protein
MGTSRGRDDRRNNDLPRKPALGSVLGGTHELRGAICEPAQAPLTTAGSPAPATTGTVRISVRLRTPRPLPRTRLPGVHPAHSTLLVGRVLRSMTGILTAAAVASCGGGGQLAAVLMGVDFDSGLAPLHAGGCSDWWQPERLLASPLDGVARREC